MVLLFLRVMAKPAYTWLWRKLRWNNWLFLGACLGTALLIYREIQLFPFQWISESWGILPLLWQQLLYLDAIHLRSILFYAALIILLWKKFDSLLPALAVGWMGLGIIELTFILQHYVGTPGRFIGWAWYISFMPLLGYGIAIIRCLKFSRKFWLLLGAAFFTQYFLLLFYPYWIVIYARDSFSVISVNQAVLPNPPWQTWIFWLLNHVMKVCFTLAFYFVELINPDE